ncbi:unnamed protein product [Clavelina lepadiformis]|uniref:Uncharacterized protein n=1 Tax=Clavelina lepadiformis TaxID=159417 RepID=A0ABP0GD30_CLALP
MKRKVFLLVVICLCVFCSISEARRSRHKTKSRSKIWCKVLKKFAGICNRRTDTQEYSVNCGSFKHNRIALTCTRCRETYGVCSKNTKLFRL